MSESTNQPTDDAIEAVRAIGTRAQELNTLAQTRAMENGDLTDEEISMISDLIDQSEHALDHAKEQARHRCAEEMAELQTLIDQIDASLAVPGLDAETRDELKRLRRLRRAKLLRLQSREAVDFAGILTAQEVEEITTVLGQARHEVAQKQKAADFLSLLVRIADFSLKIVSKASASV